MTHAAPGSWRPCTDTWGAFDELAARLPARSLVVSDERVLALHPRVGSALATREPLGVLTLRAGERIKTLGQVERICTAASLLPRTGTLLAIGGGTIGDVATVAAHLVKRGVGLVHVPTTLLAAVDSSLGGKGAVHARDGNAMVKNALGAFHYATEAWLCPELFTTLSAAQLREGHVEAWKKFLCLSPAHVDRFQSAPPPLRELVETARTLKAAVCAEDPYDVLGPRRVLNFGHTFGHAMESLSRFRVRHGEAVGLGILCALDVGVALGVTPRDVARDVEALLQRVAGVKRPRMTGAFGGAGEDAVARIVAADKKGADATRVTMVLLRAVGRTETVKVERTTWSTLLPAWRDGKIP